MLASRGDGPVYAFFDVDETVISVKSMFSFQEFWYARDNSRRESAERYQRFLDVIGELTRSGAAREEINRRYYEFYAGRIAVEVAACARAWFEHARQATGFYRASVVEALERHRKDGIEPVFVSGSLREILLPLAADLSVDHLLATRLEVVDGAYSGRISPPQMIGSGKAAAIQGFIAGRGADRDACHAYGDDISDVPMLDSVGNPHAISGNALLERHAAEQGWDVLA